MATWKEIEAKGREPRGSVYDWCWVCGDPVGPDKLHVLYDNGRSTQHVYCCRKHRYVEVILGSGKSVIQNRSDLEILSLADAFKRGKLAEGWE